jgi:hypothetical protein
MLADYGGLYAAGHRHCFVKCSVLMQEHTALLVQTLLRSLVKIIVLERKEEVEGSVYVVHMAPSSQSLLALWYSVL